MKNILIFALSLLVGTIGYLLDFTLVLHRPLTIDEIGGYIARKQAILAAVPSPRIVVFAGSNGRFSHSCAEITAQTGVRCVNLSYAATVSNRFQLDAYSAALHAGDVIYMPLEYRDERSAANAQVGDEGLYLMHADPRRILQLYDWRGVIHAAFNFDFLALVSSIGEMALDRAGVRRRFTLATMNAVGDETGHSAAKALGYRGFVASLPAIAVEARDYADARDMAPLASELARLQSRRVIVVGGLPTVPDDTRIDPQAVALLARLFESHGGCLIVLPNASRYPRTAFYDTNYHLIEPYQHRHSALLAPKLAAILKAGRCG